MKSYQEILAGKSHALGNGCFYCGQQKAFGDFCSREHQAAYYESDGPTRRWEATELVAEREYQAQWRELYR
ncbi:hypothetical protein PBI_KSSJEB_92 [Mycobacterium phage KSSJEB]|uniref:Uncharacterized protein n=1 Tax=Mycobacterium phage KSSJEB TaxID=2922216 RepID=G1D736_9CAUD|nr:hypothetical protein FGG25_gp92 [Mycobacterium phage KSSJEB]AEK10584.1 hypothetical protein PBI_KSSJEB_92 [Mycobacterium phage KSSJEB]